jgi:hypothetical protein
MNEHVLTTLLSYEAKPFLVVEPFDFAAGHNVSWNFEPNDPGNKQRQCPRTDTDLPPKCLRLKVMRP